MDIGAPLPMMKGKVNTDIWVRTTEKHQQQMKNKWVLFLETQFNTRKHVGIKNRVIPWKHT